VQQRKEGLHCCSKSIEFFGSNLKNSCSAFLGHQKMEECIFFVHKTERTMKNGFFLSLMGILLLAGCKRESALTPANAERILEKGSWRITLFMEEGDNETSDFEGYSFVFEAGGAVAATKNGNTVPGTWSTEKDDDDLKLYLNFTDAVLSEIADDWHILSQTDAKVEMEDVSGGNGGTDELVLEKN
jgi:hypothetical protein